MCFPIPPGDIGESGLQDFKKAWKTACQKAGCPGMLRYDFRRTVVRNMERAGGTRSVATKVTRYRSGSVYQRYAIVSGADLQETVKELASMISGIVSDLPSSA
jgi:hypothetical protein